MYDIILLLLGVGAVLLLGSSVALNSTSIYLLYRILQKLEIVPQSSEDEKGESGVIALSDEERWEREQRSLDAGID